MNVPFIVRFPGKIKPRLDDLMLSSPDIMPTLLGLAGLSGSIPATVQGHNYAPLFLDEKADVVRPTGALYIQNLERRMRTAKSVLIFPHRADSSRPIIRWRSI